MKKESLQNDVNCFKLLREPLMYPTVGQNRFFFSCVLCNLQKIKSSSLPHFTFIGRMQEPFFSTRTLVGGQWCEKKAEMTAFPMYHITVQRFN